MQNQTDGDKDEQDTWTVPRHSVQKNRSARSIDVRWFGTSNGYYSEEVTMEWKHD